MFSIIAKRSQHNQSYIILNKELKKVNKELIELKNENKRLKNDNINLINIINLMNKFCTKPKK